MKAFLLVLAVVLAHVPALRGEFLWDDDHYVTGNPLLTAPDGLRRIWLTHETPQYYPMVFTTFWIERRLWGLDPLGYHAVNVLLHAANALLAVALLRRIGFRQAWLAGFLFALHPVHLESVAWITERKNVLSGLFYLLAAGAFLRHEEGGGRRAYAAALGIFLLALLSKTVTASLPAALLVLRWWRGRPLDRRFLASLLPFLLLGAAMGRVTASLEAGQVGAHGAEWAFTPLQRLCMAGKALAFYAGKLAWPVHQSFVYPRAIPGAAWPLATASVLAAAWLLRGRLGRGPAAGLGFFALTVFPALGFFNVYPFRYSFVADHFQYLASLGLLVPAAALLGARGWIPLALLGAMAFRRADAFRSPTALWVDTIRKSPRAWMAHGCYGRVLYRQGLRSWSVRHYQKNLAIKPDDFFAHFALGNIGILEDRPARALPHLLKATELWPSFPPGWKSLEKACRMLLQAHADDPALHYNLGVSLLHQGREDAARESLERALALKPDLEAARRLLGRMR